MKKQNSNQGERLDQLLLGFSILGIVLFSLLIFDYSLFFKSFQTSKGIQIGTVSQLNHDVRRRASNDYVWLPVSKMETVYVGDSIFTGSRSTASIKLSSGVSLWIDPDSLVVLEQSENLTKLDLKFGNLRGTLSEQGGALLKLNVNNQDMDLEGKSVEFSLEKQKLKNTNLKVTEGQAKLTEIKSKKQILIAKKQHINIGRDLASIGGLSVLEEEPVFVRLDQWAENKNLWFSEKQRLKFIWQTDGPVDHFKLTVSTKPDMSKPIFSEVLKVNGYEWLPPFDEGKVYWKVEVFKNENAKAAVTSDVIQWNIGLLSAPEWVNTQNPMFISPLAWVKNSDTQQIAGSGNQSFSKANLEWKSMIKTSFYRMEIGKDPQFKNKNIYDIKSTNFNLPKMEVGKYYARVRSENMGRPPSLWSHTLIIDVSESDPDGLVEPLLSYNEIETQIGINGPEIKWNSQPKTVEFIIEKSATPTFESILKSQKISKNNIFNDAPGEKLGDIYYRIFPLSNLGRRGPVSKTIVWHIRPAGPVWNYKDDLLSIAIPRDKDDKLMAFPDTELNWTSWSSKIAKKEDLKQTSKVSKAKPNRSKYQDKNKIEKNLTKEVFPKMDLEKILGRPVKYVLESSNDSDFFKADRNEITLPNYTLKNLSPGFYFFRVRAVYQINPKDTLTYPNSKSSGAVNNTNQIEIISLASKILKVEVYETQMDGLMAPIISSKIPDGVLNGDANASADLKWQSVGPAEKFKVQMSDDSKFNSLIVEKIVDRNNYEFQFKKSGQYFLRVAGISSKSRVGPWSASAQWKIKVGTIALEPLDTLIVALPHPTTPVPPGVFTVKWLAPSELNQFKLELSSDLKFNKNLLKETVKGRSYQLKIQEPGKFYLRIAGLNSQGEEMTPYSKVEEIKYFVKKPLVIPELILPNDRVSYILSKIENPEVWLEWEGDKLANRFIVEFSKDRNFKKILYSLKPKEKRILLDHESIRGKVFWRVKGINEDQGLESPWSDPRSLSVVDIESDD